MAEPQDRFNDPRKDPQLINETGRRTGGEKPASERSESGPTKRVTFDDFQIQRTQQQQQVEEEKKNVSGLSACSAKKSRSQAFSSLPHHDSVS
jgi:hypothetical protein